MRIVSILRAILTLTVLMSAFAAPTQVTSATSGEIQGEVLDPTGAVIPGTHITATEESTGKQSQATTDQNGRYRFSALPPGKYSVKFEARGFRTEVKTNVTVSSDKVTQVDVPLTVGGGGWVEVIEPAIASARQPMGAIHSRVTDASGAVPARITATEPANAKTYTTTTDSNGTYQLTDLPPGKYDLRFETDGTYDWRYVRDVAVSASGITELDIVMRPVRDYVESCSGPMIAGYNCNRSSHPQYRRIRGRYVHNRRAAPRYLKRDRLLRAAERCASG
jgi:hypothetical protein